MIPPIRKLVTAISTPRYNVMSNMIKGNEKFNKFVSKYGMESANYSQTLAIMSIVLKDALGCYLYVKQSLNNKNIPDDKRAFVAALDLTNGALMIALQLMMFFSISNPKFQKKMFEKCFGKYFDKSAQKMYATWTRTQAKDSTIPKNEIYRSVESMKEATQKIFGTITSLVAASTIGKRVLVPFIATPLATHVKDKYMCKPAQDKGKKLKDSEAS